MDSENTEKRDGCTESVILESDNDCALFLKKGQLSETPPVPAQELPMTRGTSTRRFTGLFRKALWVPVGLGGLAGVFWALTCLQDFHWDIGHVASGSLWFTLAMLCWILGFAGTAALMIPARRVRQYRFPETGLGETFTGFLAAALFGVHALRQVMTAFTTAPSSAAAINTAALSKLAAGCLFLAALYFLCVGLGRRGILMTVLSMGGAVSVMLVLFRDYFQFDLPLNSPVRNLSMLAYAALLLFFLAETRVHVDLWYTGVPFTVLANVSVILLTGAYGLAEVILAIAGYTQFSMIEGAAFLGTAGLAFFRLKKLPLLIGDHLPPPPTEDEVKKAAKKKQK